MKKIFFSLVVLSFGITALADVRLPKFFSDNMVLQREHSIPVWGWAAPKEKVTVTLNQQTKTVTAGKDGKWRIDLATENAGGPYVLAIKGKNTIVINNVLIGDVWICSGQSNMEMPIAAWGFINNYKQEIADANYPMIRHFTVLKNTSATPLEDITGGTWDICSPDKAAAFSATAYFFGRELYRNLNVPIGLINTSWGGTHSETWTSREAFESSDEFKDMIAGMKSASLDEMVKQKAANAKIKIASIQGGSAPAPSAIAAWKEKDFDDSHWQTLDVPGLWENQGLADIDGKLWFRKTIMVSAEDAGKPASIELGMIDDDDETYLNGEKIGATAGYKVMRKYTVPAGALKAGKNVIAVKVNDTGGGGGMWGEAADVKITIDGKPQPLAGKWTFNIESYTEIALSINPNSYPTLLSNAMLNPLIPFAIKGAIWYQGESNSARAYQYRKAFPLMITDWRRRWQQGDFPFYFVQLATYNDANGNSNIGSAWAELREAQAMTLSLPNTGMAVTTDIGDAVDIHPKNKQDVGRRLAAIALNQTYHKNNVCNGPVYQSYQVVRNKAIITYSNIGGGLNVIDKYGYIKGFEVAGADKKFYYAKAFVNGDKVEVYSDAVSQPIAVRYGWADDAGDDNLFNKEGFPAAPFRTDNWKGITEGVKFEFEK